MRPSSPSCDPPPQALACLTPIERRWFRVADFVNRRLKWFAILWISTLGSAVVWLGVGNRVRIDGMDRLATFQPHTRALVVANHRTFWDFYVFAWITIWGSRLGRRQFFPVRSTFFYTNPIGGWINALISMMAMFPPILRSKDGKAWNRYAIERLAHELETPGTWVGIHPEGTRNRSSDPFTFLPAQRGAGQIAVGLPGIRVIPVFMHGMSNNPLREIWRNFTAPDQHPIFVCIGEDVEIDDLRAQEPSPELHAAAADRCMAAVARTAEAHRRGPTDLPRARPVRRRAALVEA